jgi:UDP-N-acetylglucosamine--N-acetylmuramyl-(pentapeptide) pyrophosphoryl-undecaprenol N-acetylglucosamine transferase
MTQQATNVSSNNASAPVMIMAGGTGGHVFPGLALAAALEAANVSVSWLGSADSFESKLVPERGIAFDALRVGGIRGKGWRQLLGAPWMVTRAVFQAASVLRRVRPRAAISFGGFAAGPGGIAAALLRIPLFVHEQNRVPGLTNRVLAKVARRVLTGFPDTINGAEFVGNPVRAQILALAAPEARFATRTGPIRLLCMGGSLGAKALNELLPQALALLPENVRPTVRHQSGAKMLDDARAAYQAAGLDSSGVTAFISDMQEAYSWADLVICRSGALTVAELAAAGLSAILVPFPFAVDDHQTANAAWLSDAGAAQVVQQAALSAQGLAELLERTNRAQCLQGAVRARALGKTQSAQRCAEVILAHST